MKYEEVWDICVWLMESLNERLGDEWRSCDELWVEEYEMVKLFGRLSDREWRVVMREMNRNGIVMKCVYGGGKGEMKNWISVMYKVVE